MAEITLRTFRDTVFSTVPSSGTSVALFAANNSRKAVLIQNTSTAIMYVYFNNGATAATLTTAHSVQLAANAFISIEGYTGAATAIWAAVNGQANITEFI